VGVLLGSLQASWALGLEPSLVQACGTQRIVSRNHPGCPAGAPVPLFVITPASSERNA